MIKGRRTEINSFNTKWVINGPFQQFYKKLIIII